jgi:hypothetical protein
MYARVRKFGVVGLILVLAGCGARLPRSLRSEIRSESDKLQSADRQLSRSEKTVRDDLASAPDLFQGTAVATAWPDRLRAARQKLDTARSQDRELERLAREDRAESRRRVEWVLAGERNLRESAVRDSEAVASDAEKWVGFRRNLGSSLETMKREHDSIRTVDLSSTAAAVAKAEQDWPSKKVELESRLAGLRAVPETIEKKWKETETARQDAASGKATGAEIATLIQTDEVLRQADLSQKADELRAQSGQLYDAWDKVLTDLDASGASYREKVKTVRTHYVDVPAKKTEISSDEKWVSVQEPAFRAVENDLGMSIGHKDAGLFDSEAQTVPQPAGFAYMATPEQGRNQYGYWANEGGHSVWMWGAEYLIMRELLWGRDYRPIVVDEYRGYRSYRDTGRTYYGQSTPEAPPKYGSHGTFTQTHYGSSRYVQSGGFKGSGYASRPGGSVATRPSYSEPRVGSAAPVEPGAGKRFGSGASGSSPSGRRFGSGASPSSPGRRFGSPSPGRSFGRRR